MLGRPGCRRGQGRAARHGRRHPRLGPALAEGRRRPRHERSGLLPLRQPQQALGHHRHRPPEGQALVRRLAAQADVLLENFKVGGLKAVRPRLRKPEGAQPAPHLLLDHRLRPDRPLCRARRLRLPDPGHGRADEPHRPPRRRAGRGPLKVGVALTDMMTGLYADDRRAGGACLPRAHGPGPAHRPGAARRAGRLRWRTRPRTTWSAAACRAAWAMRTRTSCPTRTSPPPMAT